MVNYQNSKIYKIEPVIDHEEGDIYIGSTTKEYLSQRMDAHRNNYNCWKLNGKGNHVRSYDLFNKYGLENCKIYLIENFPCQTVNELRAREGHYIKTLKCVNKLVAGRSMKEYREDNIEKLKELKKQYYESNKEEILGKQQIYRKDNEPKIKEYFKQHYLENKEKISEYQKQYYDENREKVKIRCKLYQDQHKDKKAEYQKKYREENKEKSKLYKKQYYEENKEKIKEAKLKRKMIQNTKTEDPIETLQEK